MCMSLQKVCFKVMSFRSARGFACHNCSNTCHVHIHEKLCIRSRPEQWLCGHVYAGLCTAFGSDVWLSVCVITWTHAYNHICTCMTCKGLGLPRADYVPACTQGDDACVYAIMVLACKSARATMILVMPQEVP